MVNKQKVGAKDWKTHFGIENQPVSSINFKFQILCTKTDYLNRTEALIFVFKMFKSHIYQFIMVKQIQYLIKLHGKIFTEWTLGLKEDYKQAAVIY
jgi:hypothetical protein